MLEYQGYCKFILLFKDVPLYTNFLLLDNKYFAEPSHVDAQKDGSYMQFFHDLVIDNRCSH
jgi:hypothetical protein